LSAIQELIQQDLDGHSRLKFIQLVWSVQDPGQFYFSHIAYSPIELSV
jgi:hypothetical protein